MQRFFAVILAFSAIMAFVPVQAHAQPATGTAIEYIGHRSYYGFTRLVFGTGSATPDKFIIKYDEVGRRLVFAPPDSSVAFSFDPVRDVDDVVTEIDYTQVREGKLGVVLRLGRAATGYSISYLYEPNRLVIDIYRQSRPGQFMPLYRDVRTVVVDAGHGGTELGVLGPDAMTESSVTLELADRLTAILQARGFDTVLTRNADAAMTPHDRAAKADSTMGDLYVSLHLSVDSGIKVLSCDEGRLGPGKPPATGLIWSEQQPQYLPESLKLARTVADRLKGLRGERVSVHSVRLAGFDGLAMPAVLVEFGGFERGGTPYGDDKYLDRLAGMLADAVATYAGGR